MNPKIYGQADNNYDFYSFTRLINLYFTLKRCFLCLLCNAVVLFFLWLHFFY